MSQGQYQQHSNPSAIRTRMTFRHVPFTMVLSTDEETDWINVTVNVVEVRDEATVGQSSHWGIGIYPPPPLESKMIDLISQDWTTSWVEDTRMVILRGAQADGSFVQYYLVLSTDASFFKLVSLCSSIKMYAYTGIFLG
ncbi:hypothetical protein GY45DRAFT_1372443 [Cubamyces sp. BRFM 1775]|nr:hypothetical protein GY45DRAFT_1372443 [Cubamyces sp. BRFM 1775]